MTARERIAKARAADAMTVEISHEQGQVMMAALRALAAQGPSTAAQARTIIDAHLASAEKEASR